MILPLLSIRTFKVVPVVVIVSTWFSIPVLRKEEINVRYGLDDSPPVMTDVSTVKGDVSPSPEKTPFTLPSLGGRLRAL